MPSVDFTDPALQEMIRYYTDLIRRNELVYGVIPKNLPDLEMVYSIADIETEDIEMDLP